MANIQPSAATIASTISGIRDCVDAVSAMSCLSLVLDLSENRTSPGSESKRGAVPRVPPGGAASVPAGGFGYSAATPTASTFTAQNLNSGILP